MLLGDLVLSAARIWARRQIAELEAAALFSILAHELDAVGGDGRLVAAARAAAADERRHAERCRAIVDRLAPGTQFSTPEPAAAPGPLGPRDLSRADRALYAAVALSSVTETLSTALLMEMRPHVTDPLVRQVVNEILRDEVDHARIGWAHLANEAARRDVGWLGDHVPHMLRAALPDEGVPASPEGGSDGRGVPELGVLPRDEILRVSNTVGRDVLVPGLARFGVAVTGAPLGSRD